MNEDLTLDDDKNLTQQRFNLDSNCDFQNEGSPETNELELQEIKKKSKSPVREEKKKKPKKEGKPEHERKKVTKKTGEKGKSKG